MLTNYASSIKVEKFADIKVAYFGDSHIHRLDMFTCGYVNIATTAQRWFGAGGMTAGTTGNAAEEKREKKMREAIAFQPEVVVISLGGNDINEHCRPREIHNNVMTIVSRFREAGAKKVFVIGIIPRLVCRAMDATPYDKVRRRINKQLQCSLCEDFLSLLSMSARQVVGDDGVHLHDRGNLKLLKVLRLGLSGYPGLKVE